MYGRGAGHEHVWNARAVRKTLSFLFPFFFLASKNSMKRCPRVPRLKRRCIASPRRSASTWRLSRRRWRRTRKPLPSTCANVLGNLIDTASLAIPPLQWDEPRVRWLPLGHGGSSLRLHKRRCALDHSRRLQSRAASGERMWNYAVHSEAQSESGKSWKRSHSIESVFIGVLANANVLLQS